MQNTHDDYVLDVPYTWEFFDVQNPAYLSYMANTKGIPAPSVREAFTYCELGCGNGLTSNLLAAALPNGKFYAVDFNPEHIANAEYIAQQGELDNIHLICCDFEALLQKDDVPAMDFITLHGVYSWVSSDIRTQVLKVIDRYLKPGGLLYVSYNPLPRWAEITPMWRIMLEHVRHMQTDSISKAKEGLRYLSELRDNNVQYMRTSPGASHFLDELLQRDIRFVAHEFCNNYLEPQYFIDVANTMSQIGLEFCGNAGFEDSENFIPGGLLGYVKGEADEVAQESRRSLLSNEFFRRDIYIRGNKNSFANSGKRPALMSDWVIGSQYTDFQIHRIFPAYKSDIRLQGEIYETVMKTAYQGTFNLSDLCAHEGLETYSPEAVIDAVHNLVKYEHLDVLINRTEASSDNKAFPETFELLHPINRYLLENRLLQDGQCCLVSPVLGSAIQIDLVSGLCLLALLKAPEEGILNFINTELCRFTEQPHPNHPDQKKFSDKGWLEGQWEEFRENRVPVLLRYKILAGKL